MATAKKKSNDQTNTPLMRQYYKIKQAHPEAVLLFRMGDFYEAFDTDAVLIADALGITLTKRSNGKAGKVALAGFPYHSLDTYLPRLVRAGHRVAICEQLENPKTAKKKLVKRGVVEVVTPGVVLRDQLLDPRQATYLAAIAKGDAKNNKGMWGVSFSEASTGEFFVTEVSESELPALLQTISPAELLFDKSQRAFVQEIVPAGCALTPQEGWLFGFDFGYEVLLRHFKTNSLKGFGVESQKLGLVAAGAVLYYLGEMQKGRLPHIRKIEQYDNAQYISLDPQTRRNLELVSTLNDGQREGSLVQILDQTQTPMGARLLRSWLVRPLRNLDAIERRLSAVDLLLTEDRRRENLRDELKHVGDLERLVAKVCMGRCSPRDMSMLYLTLKQVPVIKPLLSGVESELLSAIDKNLSLCPDVVDRIGRIVVDDPPANLVKGGVVKSGVSDELDELRLISKSGKDWMTKMVEEESERTGIPSLKVGYNRVFGYYLEVTHLHTDKVPDDYIRKQTLTSAERYITPALKEYEEKILTAEDRIISLEQSIFEELRMIVAESAGAMQQNAAVLGQLDCLATFAEVASDYDYVRPIINDEGVLDITAGRHPVVERMLPPGEPFIPNSIKLDADNEQIIIITGPNMAGKSVALRQVGLIVLLAQVGCFVPAKRAVIGVVDKIFTRVGASDNLSAGESTFLVEMNETANILNNVTPKSLILLDEVGRGTSTFDGLSIAWAIVEYLHQQPSATARTMFATHYHELNAMADQFDRIRNARIEVKEHDGKIVFLRTLAAGGADHSYGIEVARMAGLPNAVINRAKTILQHLESQELAVNETLDETAPVTNQGDGQAETTTLPKVAPTSAPPADPGFQMSLFAGDPVAEEIRTALKSIDTNTLTPIEALLKLAELKKMAT